MKIGIVLFDGFTDLDFFLAWDLLNRVRLLKLSDDWEVLILGNKNFFQSAAGLQVPVHKSYEFANQCDAVVFCSGPLTKNLINDNDFLSQFQFNISKQFVAGMCSGTLIMAALGFLKNKKATTYPTSFSILESLGAIPTRDSFIQEGHTATASQCLSGTELALWIIERLAGKDIAVKVYETIKPLKEFK